MSTIKIASLNAGREKDLWRRWMGLFIFLAALFALPCADAADSNESEDQAVVQQMLDSIAKKDYEGFIGRGTPDFAKISKAQFTQVADAIGPRLQQGYTVKYLGVLRQQGLNISVWKVSFTDKGDDILATLNVQNGKVGGFFLR